MRTRALSIMLFVASLAACGKSRECQQFADRNVEHADAIEGAIMADYERFARLAQRELGRAPPPRVRAAAAKSAAQWRDTLTDPLLAQTCTADWPQTQLSRLTPCLEHEDAQRYATCVLDGMDVPRLADDGESEGS